jgi:hypothetical protein
VGNRDVKFPENLSSGKKRGKAGEEWEKQVDSFSNRNVNTDSRIERPNTLKKIGSSIRQFLNE